MPRLKKFTQCSFSSWNFFSGAFGWELQFSNSSITSDAPKGHVVTWIWVCDNVLSCRQGVKSVQNAEPGDVPGSGDQLLAEQK